MSAEIIETYLIKEKDRIWQSLLNAIKIDKDVKSQFISNVQELIKTKNLPLPVSTDKPFYPMPVRIVTHCFQCKILVKNKPGFRFPLEEMNFPNLLVFYLKEESKNVIMFLKDKSPSALFTRYGYITLTGGSNIEEIYECFLLYIAKIMQILTHLFPTDEFDVGTFKLSSKAATTNLLTKNICVPKLIDDLRAHGFTVKKNEKKIGFPFIKRFFPFGSNISFCIAATGGINILGFKYNYEAKIAYYLLSAFLIKHTTLQKDVLDDDNYRKKALELLEEKKLKSKRLNQNKKKRKIEKWINLDMSISSLTESLEAKASSVSLKRKKLQEEQQQQQLLQEELEEEEEEDENIVVEDPYLLDYSCFPPIIEDDEENDPYYNQSSYPL